MALPWKIRGGAARYSLRSGNLLARVAVYENGWRTFRQPVQRGSDADMAGMAAADRALVGGHDVALLDADGSWLLETEDGMVARVEGPR